MYTWSGLVTKFPILQFLLLVSIVTAQEPVRPLVIGTPVEREMKGGQAHVYQIDCMAGDYFHAVVEQKGIDVAVTILGPNGQKVLEIDSPNGSEGPEPIFLLVEAGGLYRIEIRSLEAGVPAGRYAILETERRAATDADRHRVAGTAAAIEANHLLDEGKAESIRAAIAKFGQALTHFQAIEDAAAQADALHNMGIASGTISQLRDAVAYYQRALPLWRAAGKRAGEADTLMSLASDLAHLSEDRQALEYYEQALKAYREVGDRAFEARVLNNIGSVYQGQAEYQKAFQHFNQAWELLKTAENPEIKAHTLTNLALALSSYGEQQRALDYLKQALPLIGKLQNNPLEVKLMRLLGPLTARLESREKGLEYLQRGLALTRRMGDRQSEAMILDSIAVYHRELNEPQKAVGFATEALALMRASGDSGGEGLMLRRLGFDYLKLDENQKAAETLHLALDLSRAVRDRESELACLNHLAQLDMKEGRLTEAREKMRQVLELFESLRAQVPGEALRSTFFANAQEHYEIYIDLLARLHQSQPDKGYLAEALETNERARARGLLDLLVESQTDIRQGVDASLLARERGLQQQLNAKAAAQTKLLSGRHTRSQADEMEKSIQELTARHDEIWNQIRTASPRFAALTRPQPLVTAEIQSQILDENTLLLEYALGEKQSRLWLVSRTAFSGHALPPRAEIEAAAKKVYDLMTARQQASSPDSPAKIKEAEDQLPGEAARLSNLLLGPVGSQLENKRLVIVASGILEYLPFGALPVPSESGRGGKGESGGNSVSPRSLIAEHEIVTLPSASVLGLIRRETSARTPAAEVAAVFADPVFAADDPRIAAAKKSSGNADLAMVDREAGSSLARTMRDFNFTRLSRLPFSRQEAEALLAYAPGPSNLKALSFDANRQRATSADLSRYRILHFATHGLLNSEHPELSGLVLSLVDPEGKSRDGFLRLHDIYDLKLRADLVVLSACQTGLGKQIRGEGLVGLTRGFMYAGAPRIVASLWQVNDVATAELMKSFYRGLLKENLRPAAALRAAQLELMKQKRWSSPFYWAPFVLQGEWR